MKEGTLKQYLFGIIVWPVLALLVLVSIFIYQTYRDYTYSQSSLYLTQVLVASSQLAHAVQLERGAGMFVLRSRGENRSELRVMRENTDRFLAAYLKLLALQDASLPKRLDAYPVALANMRQQLDAFTLSPLQLDMFFAEFISVISDYIKQQLEQEIDADVQRSLLAYQSLILVKEQLAQERSLSILRLFSQVDLEFQEALQARINKQQAHFDVFNALAPNESNRLLARVLEGDEFRVVQSYRKQLLHNSGRTMSDAEILRGFKESGLLMSGLFDVERQLMRNLEYKLQEKSSSLRQLLAFQFGGALLVFLFTLALIIRLSGSIILALKQIVVALEKVVVEGDFVHRVPEQGIRETVRVAQAVNTLLNQCRQMVVEAVTMSERIEQTAKHLTCTSAEVNKSSYKQADAAAHVASVMEEVSTSVSETSGNAQLAGVFVAQSQEKSIHVLSEMAEAVRYFEGVARIIRSSNDKVHRLAVRSEEIDKIAKIIQGIAKQTNLLALNAAIEAARAGEQGRGFAIVADEVRKLSEQTRYSTTEITNVIVAIQQQVSDTVDEMQLATGQVANSLERIMTSEGAIRGISVDATEIASNVKSIALAIREQDSAVHQVADNIERIAQMAEENTVIANESSQVASELNKLSSQLRASVAQYRV